MVAAELTNTLLGPNLLYTIRCCGSRMLLLWILSRRCFGSVKFELVIDPPTMVGLRFIIYDQKDYLCIAQVPPDENWISMPVSRNYGCLYMYLWFKGAHIIVRVSLSSCYGINRTPMTLRL